MTPTRPTPNSPELRDAAIWQALIDQLACGIALFDQQDRLVVCNEDFRRLYEPIADELVTGRRFEDIVRAAVRRGLIPQAEGREEEWIAQRLVEHRRPSGPILRRLRDGRWRRIEEKALPDGHLLAFSVDVTEVVTKAEQLEGALQAARVASEWLNHSIEALPAGFELWDARELLVVCNSELRRMYPKIANLLVPGSRWEDLVRANHALGALDVPKQDLDDYIRRRRVARRAGSVPAEHATDEGRWIRTVEQATRNGGLVCVRLDITELRQQRMDAQQAQRTAEANRQRLVDAIEALPDGFALYDGDDRLVAWNARYRELYAMSAPAMTLGAKFEDVLRYGVEHGQYPQALSDAEGWIEARLHRHRHPGLPVIQELPGNRWLRIDERQTSEGGVAGVRTDVTELVRREQKLQELNAALGEARAKLEHLSETDALTELANRRQFDRRLIDEAARCARTESPLALLLIDVDHFKHFNDTYGHLAGDEGLRQVSRVLRLCAGRATDLVARYGGEEFAILLPNTHRDAATLLAQRCIEALGAQAIEHRSSPTARDLTISIGVAAVASARGVEPAALLRDADQALYAAKDAGRHRVVVAPQA